MLINKGRIKGYLLLRLHINCYFNILKREPSAAIASLILTLHEDGGLRIYDFTNIIVRGVLATISPKNLICKNG